MLWQCLQVKQALTQNCILLSRQDESKLQTTFERWAPCSMPSVWPALERIGLGAAGRPAVLSHSSVGFQRAPLQPQHRSRDGQNRWCAQLHAGCSVSLAFRSANDLVPCSGSNQHTLPSISYECADSVVTAFCVGCAAALVLLTPDSSRQWRTAWGNHLCTILAVSC